MAILKNPGKNSFTVVDNYALRDSRLSLKARGLLVTMLSLPDNWQFSENGLCSIFEKDGQASIRSGLKELEDGGYLVRKRTRDDHGRVSSVEWVIFDKPHLENPNVVTPNLENRPQLNTKESSIKESNMKGCNIARKRFTPPTVEEVAAYCHERQNRVDAQRFVDFYEAKGWMVGRSKMKDWKAAVRTWEKPRDDVQGRHPETEGQTTYSRMNKIFEEVRRMNAGEW